MDAQNTPGDRMEGAEPRHAFHRLAEHLAEPEFHLARGLVGEGHRQDFVRPRPALAQDMGDARGEHARLAGAGAGQDQHGSIQRLDRLALLRIEPGKILRRRRRTGARGDAASQWLVLGNAVLGQLARLGHARIVLAPRWHREAVKGSLLSRDYGPYRASSAVLTGLSDRFAAPTGGFVPAKSANFAGFQAGTIISGADCFPVEARSPVALRKAENGRFGSC